MTLHTHERSTAARAVLKWMKHIERKGYPSRDLTFWLVAAGMSPEGAVTYATSTMAWMIREKVIQTDLSPGPVFGVFLAVLEEVNRE